MFEEPPFKPDNIGATYFEMSSAYVGLGVF